MSKTTTPVDAELVAGALIIAKSVRSQDKSRREQGAAIYALRKDNGGKFTDDEIAKEAHAQFRALYPESMRAAIKAPMSSSTVSNLGKAHSLHVEAGLPRITNDTFAIAYNAVAHSKADRRNAVIAAVAALPEDKRERAFIAELTRAVKGQDSKILSAEENDEIGEGEKAEKEAAEKAPFEGALKLAERIRTLAEGGKVPAGQVGDVAAELQRALIALAAQDVQASGLAKAAAAKKSPRATVRQGATVTRTRVAA